MQGLLPPPEAVLPGVRIVCRHTPSSELGGDLYDFAAHLAGRTAPLVADVVGHGASAPMLTAVVKSAVRACEPDDYDPVAVTERVRAGIAPFGFDRFVTLIAARVSPSEGRLTDVNAGHPPGLLWNGRRRDRPEGTGPLSPALPGSRSEEASIQIASGDHLLLYTDGVLDGQTVRIRRCRASMPPSATIRREERRCSRGFSTRSTATGRPSSAGRPHAADRRRALTSVAA